jgi:hypothetical protein
MRTCFTSRPNYGRGGGSAEARELQGKVPKHAREPVSCPVIPLRYCSVQHPEVVPQLLTRTASIRAGAGEVATAARPNLVDRYLSKEGVR